MTWEYKRIVSPVLLLQKSSRISFLLVSPQGYLSLKWKPNKNFLVQFMPVKDMLSFQ